ncbi:hypothetical protein O181_088569 [Austropuccinia psidii MF-1]|uniref:HTH CENPB-type domain-containing protein n=1 Tax=Austropuccinia psidii MF-1 TaxID=1389203 RepID=A0A9Q3P3W2_9BASI|nr:hypothetical protein [Austropuccinia psidii MF-1]
MLSRSSSSTLLAPSFLPSISTLGPDPSYHHPSSPHHHHPQQQQTLPPPPPHHHLHHPHHQHHQHHLQRNHLNNHHHHYSHHSPLPHTPMRSPPPLSRNPSYSHHAQVNSIHLTRPLTGSTPSGRPPPKTSRRQSKLNNLDRRRICEYAAAHPKATQEDIAVQWGIDRSSVSKILKYREKWLSISPTARAAKVIKHRGGRFPQLESEVVRRCKEKSIEGGFLGDRTIKDVALVVSQEMGLGEGAFKASNGWLDAFKERAQIKGGRFLDMDRGMGPPMPDQPCSTLKSSNHRLATTLDSINSNSNIIITPGEQKMNYVQVDDLEGEEDEEEEEEEDDDDEGEEEELEEEEDDDLDEDEQAKAKQEQGDLEYDSTQVMNTEIKEHQTLPSFQENLRDSSPQSDYRHQHPSSAPTPPLSSPNSSNEGSSHGVKMQELAETLNSPLRAVGPENHGLLSDVTIVNTHDRLSDNEQEEADGMDGIEQISSATDSGSGDQTVVFKSSHHYHHHHHPANSHPNHHSTHHSRSFYGGQSDYRPVPEHCQPSSSHSRSSSLSIGSLSQQSSIYGDELYLNSPSATGLKMHPPHQLSSYASQPNFHPPPLRTAPVRRTFPSLRHAMSHPAFNSTGTTRSSQSGPPMLPPMSASSPAHQFASFPFPASSFSPVSAPPNHQAHSHLPFPSKTTSRLELAPVCPSRISHHLHSNQRDETADWTGDDSEIGFDEALGALETVMRFLQDQPTSFATPRDYMVVGELFGRMKEKKQEMMGIGNGNTLLHSRRLISSSAPSGGINPIRNGASCQQRPSSSSSNQPPPPTSSSSGNGLSLVMEDNHSMDRMEI